MRFQLSGKFVFGICCSFHKRFIAVKNLNVEIMITFLVKLDAFESKSHQYSYLRGEHNVSFWS